jgi:hypothetical protein
MGINYTQKKQGFFVVVGFWRCFFFFLERKCVYSHSLHCECMGQSRLLTEFPTARKEKGTKAKPPALLSCQSPESQTSAQPLGGFAER